METVERILNKYSIWANTASGMKWDEYIFFIFVSLSVFYAAFSILAVFWRGSESIAAWRDMNLAKAKYFEAHAEYLEEKKKSIETE